MKRTIHESGDCLTILQKSDDPINPVRLECDEVVDFSDMSVDSEELVGSFVSEWKARKSGRFEGPALSNLHGIEVNEALLLSTFNHLPIDTEELIQNICATPAAPLVEQKAPDPEPRAVKIDPSRRLLSSGTVSKSATLVVRERKISEKDKYALQVEKDMEEEITPILVLEQLKLDAARLIQEQEEKIDPSTRLFVFGDADFLEIGVLESCANVFKRMIEYGDRAPLSCSSTVNDDGVAMSQITIPADLLEDLKFVSNTLLAQISCYLRFTCFFRDIYARSDPLPVCTLIEPVTAAERELRTRLDSFQVDDVLTEADRAALTNMENKLHATVSRQNDLYYQKHRTRIPYADRMYHELQVKAVEFVSARYRPKVKSCSQLLEILKLYEADCFYNPMVNQKYAGQANEAKKLKVDLLSNLEETRREHMRHKAKELHARAEACLSIKQVLQHVFEYAQEVPATYNDLMAAVVGLYGVTLGVYSHRVASRFRICQNQKRRIQLVYSSHCHPDVVSYMREVERLDAQWRARGMNSEWDSSDEGEREDIEAEVD